MDFVVVGMSASDRRAQRPSKRAAFRKSRPLCRPDGDHRSADAARWSVALAATRPRPRQQKQRLRPARFPQAIGSQHRDLLLPVERRRIRSRRLPRRYLKMAGIPGRPTSYKSRPRPCEPPRPWAGAVRNRSVMLSAIPSNRRPRRPATMRPPNSRWVRRRAGRPCQRRIRCRVPLKE